MTNPKPPKPAKARRGFASMPIEQRRRIASMGGKAAHESGNAHEYTSEEGRAAGLKSQSMRGQKTR